MTHTSLTNTSAETPSVNFTTSYWHRDPSKKLLSHRTTAGLPSTADVVVVGSGITGTFAARELVAGGRSVVMLESREACWGATGRNGGHCNPGVWTSTPEVARFELATFNLIKELVAEHNIPCDWQMVGSIHPIFSEDILKAAEKRMQALQQDPELQDKAVLILDKHALAEHRIPAARAAVYQPNAAKLWPYKLVAWLLERLLHENDVGIFNLQTHTQVKQLQRYGSSWVVHTQRGQIAARDVLLATNAYTPYLLPRMTELIVPMRSQICALVPPPGASQLRHSYGWFNDCSDNKYLTHNFLIQHRSDERPVPDGEANNADADVMAPGETSLIFGIDLTGPDGDEGKWRDDELNPVMSRMLRQRLPHTLNLSAMEEPEAEANELHATYEWTGIMGYSRDGNPWVGRVPETLVSSLDAATDADGLWICAGYTGHGMPTAARCGIAVAEMMMEKEGGSVLLPRGWLISEGRAERARRLEMPMTVRDMAQMLAAI